MFNFLKCRTARSLSVIALLLLVPNVTFEVKAAALEPGALMPNGMHYQSWIKEHKQFLIKDILADAKTEGKGVAILFEEKGCPYCARLHAENFTYDDVVAYMTQHFNVIQIDYDGDRPVTMLDGTTLSERAFSRKYRVSSTPTTMFMRPDGKESFRMPGFIQAAIYKAGFQYVVEKGPTSGVSFIPWVKALIKRTRAAQLSKP